MVECKTSRADFFHDQEKRIRARDADKQLGNERWFMTPRKMITRDELPKGWGLVEVTEQKAFVVLTAPHHRTKADRLEMALLATCLGRLQSDRYAEAFQIPEAWVQGKFWAQLQVKDADGLEMDLVAEETELGPMDAFGENEYYRRQALAEMGRRKIAAMSDTLFRSRSAFRDHPEFQELLKIVATLSAVSRKIVQIGKTKKH